MQLKELSKEDLERLHAFIEVACAEAVGRDWAELEPLLLDSWTRMRRPTSPPWSAVSDYVRDACCRAA